MRTQFEIDEEVKLIDGEIRGLQERRKLLWSERAKLLLGLEIGDVIEDRSGRRMVINSFCGESYCPSAYGFRIKKDGTHGGLIRISDYQNPRRAST